MGSCVLQGPLDTTACCTSRRFMRQLVEARCQAGSSKMRRTTGAAMAAPPQLDARAADGTAGGAVEAADRPLASSRRGEDFDAAARVAMELATSFMFKVRATVSTAWNGVLNWCQVSSVVRQDAHASRRRVTCICHLVSSRFNHAWRVCVLSHPSNRPRPQIVVCPNPNPSP